MKPRKTPHLHTGHRKRMKLRFLRHGLDNFDDHNVLELMLFYAIPRIDVNPLSHLLLEKFGSLHAVFDAPISELMKVQGIGESSAALIKLIPQLNRRYMLSKNTPCQLIGNSKEAGAYLAPYFHAERDEVVYALFLDSRGSIIKCECIFRGTATIAPVTGSKLISSALSCLAAGVILAHNHPGGFALPSADDIETTNALFDLLKGVNIKLCDHLIFSEDDFVSLADSGLFHFVHT